MAWSAFITIKNVSLLMTIGIILWTSSVHSSRQCGSSKTSNGTQADVGEFPWHVSIQRENIHHCDGTVIDKKWILAAAHCFFKDDEEPQDGWTIVAGGINLESLNGSEQSVKAKRIIVHSEFNEPKYSNNIALIELDKKLQYNDYVQPACMPNGKEKLTDKMCTVSGFGRPNKGGVSPQLLKVSKPVVSTEKCQQHHCKFNTDIYNSNVCAAYTSDGRDACSADSTGPLVCKKIVRWFVAGIVSHGEECGLEEVPVVYTRVSDYLDWIEHHTNIRFGNGSHLTPPGQEPEPFTAPAVTVPFKCTSD